MKEKSQQRISSKIKSMTAHRLLLFCVGLLLATASGLGQHSGEKSQPRAELEVAKLGTTENVHRFGEIWLASQPSTEDFALARKSGFRTVINLRRESELPNFDEKQIVESQGLTYLHLPFGGTAELTEDIFDTARGYLKTAEQPILLHCASANRVGALWLPFRVLDQGISYEDALAEARTIGLRTPALEEKAREYIQSRE